MPGSNRIQLEDALKCLHESEYAGRPACVGDVAVALGIDDDETRSLLEEMAGNGLLSHAVDRWTLTDAGREYARRILRAHRLVETYLARETSLPPKKWHAKADQREHKISQAEVDALADHLGRPRFDPHGDPIPTREGDLPPSRAVPLAQWDIGVPARISHIEDEPEKIYLHLAAQGLAPGQVVRVTGRAGDGMTLDAQGLTIRLTAVEAAQISVVPLAGEALPPADAMRLSQVMMGSSACVVGIAPICLGAQRTRLLDLGVVPGSAITPELVGISSSPVAYRVRGTLIALRREQAEQIIVRSP